MKTELRMVLVLMLGFALTTAAGCAKEKHFTPSGFLKDYPYFSPGPKGGVDFVYFKEGVDFRSYDKIMMDEVAFYFEDDALYKGIYADDLKELEDAFHQAMAEAFKGGYPLVEQPGPGIMRLRVAITDVVPSKPVLNTITTIVPVGLAISHIKKGITGTHTHVGQASMEMELLDSQTNEQIAAAIDTKAAEKYKVFKGMSKWGHTKEVFKIWGKHLRDWLDKIHGRIG